MAESKGLLSGHPTLKVYFDGGYHYARSGHRARAHFGWAIFPIDATRDTQPLSITFAGSALGLAIGFWDLEGQTILERVGDSISSYPAAHAIQLYDLVAAYAALLHLRTNHYRGAISMIGDGKEVIDFLKGRDQALHLEVDGTDLARWIRDRIQLLRKDLGELSWEWVPTNANWVDRILKAQDAELGDR
jgi:hypothetical protein